MAGHISSGATEQALPTVHAVIWIVSDTASAAPETTWAATFPERTRDLDGVAELLRRNGLAPEDTGIEVSHLLDGSPRLGRLREANDPALGIGQQPASDRGPDERQVRRDRHGLEKFEREALRFLFRQPFEDDLLERGDLRRNAEVGLVARAIIAVDRATDHPAFASSPLGHALSDLLLANVAS